MPSPTTNLNQSLLGSITNSSADVELNEEPSIQLIPSKAEQFLEELGLTQEQLEQAGFDYKALTTLLNVHLSRSILRLISYDNFQLKALLWPFISKEDVQDFKTPSDSISDKFRNYFNNRVWPKARSLLYKSPNALKRIAAAQSFLSTSGLVSTKAWTLLLLSLQINELVYYFQFFNDSVKRAFYSPFTFHPKVDAKKILSQSLSQTPVWTSILAVPLGLGMLSALYSRLTYNYDNNTVDNLIQQLNNHQPSWHPFKIYNIQQILSQTQNVLIWNGQLSSQQRLDLFNQLIDFASNKATGITQLQALAILGDCLTAIHPKDFKKLTILSNWTEEEEDQHIQSLLRLKSDALATLLTISQSKLPSNQYLSRKDKWLQHSAHQLKTLYTTYLLWETGHPQSRLSSSVFWGIKFYLVYTTYTLAKSVIQGIQNDYQLNQNKTKCEAENNHWYYFDQAPSADQSPGWYCSPCPEFPIQPKNRFVPQDCIWGLMNQSRSFDELKSFFDPSHGTTPLKNWSKVIEISFLKQSLNDVELADILGFVCKRADDLRDLFLNHMPPSSHQKRLHIGRKSAKAIASCVNKIDLNALYLNYLNFNNQLLTVFAENLKPFRPIKILSLLVQYEGPPDNVTFTLTSLDSLITILKKLNKLELLILQGNALTNKALLDFSKKMTFFHENIRVLDLAVLTNGTANTLTDISPMAPILLRMRNLLELNLGQNAINNIGLAGFVEGLNNKTHPLEKLDLDFQADFYGDATLTNIAPIAKLLEYLYKLKYLDVSDNAISNAGVIEFSGNLTSIHNSLEEIDLGSQQNGFGQTTLSIFSVFSNILDYLIALKKLGLSANGICTDQFDQFAVNMANKTHGLEKLIFESQRNTTAGRCFNSIDSLPILLNAFPNMSSLFFSDNAIPDTSITNIANQIVNQTFNLNVLSLGGQVQGSQNILCSMEPFHLLLKSFNKLEQLLLSGNCISDASFRQFSNKVETHGALEEIYLNQQQTFAQTPTLTDASPLARILEKLIALKHLDLDVNGITDTSLGWLAGNMTSVTSNLEFLGLSGQQTNNGLPTIKSLSAFAELLKYLINLKVLGLGANGVNDEGLKIFSDLLKGIEHPSLQSLYLHNQRNGSAPTLHQISSLPNLLDTFSSLEFVTFAQNAISASAMDIMSKLLVKKYPLKSLEIGAQIGGLDTLLPVIRTLHFLDEIVELGLGDNLIDNHVLKDLSDALLNYTQAPPELWLIKLSRQNRDSFVAPAQNYPNLKSLYLAHNKVGNTGAKDFCERAILTNIGFYDGSEPIFDDNFVTDPELMSCSVINGASRSDLFGLFSLMKRAGRYYSSISNNQKNIRYQQNIFTSGNFTTRPEPEFLIKPPYIITNRHFSLPKCIGPHCNNIQQFAYTQPYELTMLLHGGQTTLFSILTNLFDCILHQAEYSKDTINLSLFATRMGINYCLGFRGHSLYAKELFILGFTQGLNQLGFNQATINKVTSAASMLLGIGLFIMQAKDSFLQVTVLTVISFMGGWLGGLIAEEAANYIGCDEGVKRRKQVAGNPHGLFSNKDNKSDSLSHGSAGISFNNGHASHLTS